MTKKVLIVGCGFPQLSLIREARHLGLHVLGADANPRAVGVAHCSDFIEVSTGDENAIANAARASGVDGITTCGSELALRTTARVAHLLGLPFYADPETIERCQSKDRMRRAYAEGKAPIPAFLAAKSFDEARSFVRERGLPVVVKPARGWGQRGVSKVVNEGELRVAFDAAMSATTDAVVMVESFVEGREFSVNAYTQSGTTTIYSVTERIITEYPDPPGITFAEWYPAGLENHEIQAVTDAALAGISALGIERGPSYTQIRYGSRGAFLIETAHRLGGGLDPDVAKLASGVSLFRKILGVAIDREDWEDFGQEIEPHGGAIGKFLIGKAGRVASIEGVEEARRMPGIENIELYVDIGGTVHPLTDGSKRIGHILATGKDRLEASHHAEAAATMIRITTS